MHVYLSMHAYVILVVFVAREKNAAKVVTGRLVTQWNTRNHEYYNTYKLHKGLLLKF